jgi:hypothetical protein
MIEILGMGRKVMLKNLLKSSLTEKDKIQNNTGG